MLNWLKHLFVHLWEYDARFTKRTCTRCGKVQYQVAFGDERMHYGFIWRDRPYSGEPCE